MTAAFPKKVACFTASFLNVGQSNETLRLSWLYGVPGTIDFIVGTDCFLEDPAASNSLASVPDEHFVASVSMMGILNGVIIGTKEWLDAVANQNIANFQMIVGTVKIQGDPVLVGTTVIPGGVANLYDITFFRSGQSGNTKVVQMDSYTLSQYDNRINNPANSVYCMLGAIFKQFPTYKKSNLGAAESAQRIAVQDFVASWPLWI